MSTHYQAKTALGRIVNEIEETAIAVLLGLMTLITFVNVVLRYGFNTGLIWGLEAVTFLFAWLVLFGLSYAVKVTAHDVFGRCHEPVQKAGGGCGTVQDVRTQVRDG